MTESGKSSSGTSNRSRWLLFAAVAILVLAVGVVAGTALQNEPPTPNDASGGPTAEELDRLGNSLTSNDPTEISDAILPEVRTELGELTDVAPAGSKLEFDMTSLVATKRSAMVNAELTGPRPAHVLVVLALRDGQWYVVTTTLSDA